MRKSGRPRKFTTTIHINVKADMALKVALESYATQHNQTVSEVIRAALYAFLRSQGSHYNDPEGILRSRKL